MCSASLEGFVLESRSGPRSDRPSPDQRLSKRQSEVLTLMAAGSSVKEIAAALNLAPDTIKSHMRGAYTRLNVRSSAAAVREAMRLGLIDHYQTRRRETI